MSVGGILRAPGKAPVAKRVTRDWFVAALSGGVLVPRRGCSRVTVELGDEIIETTAKDSTRQLMCNVGDRLLLMGAATEEVAVAHVAKIQIDGWTARISVLLSAGAVNDGVVNVLKLKGAA